MTILITGGAGYIGSITNTALRKLGHTTVVFDNLSTGHRKAVGTTPLIEGDLKNKADIDRIFSRYSFDAVIHFAALALAPESMEQPCNYYVNNVMGGLNLLEVMREHNCHAIVFSSSCSVYGTPEKLPVTENAPIHPESVYASSKRMFEEILDWYDELYGIKSIKLRYFNASGATLDGNLGESHQPETHIIPLALEVTAGKREVFEIYGKDYPTPDGTCIRDYIHVLDLADAHVSAMEYLKTKHQSDSFNLGVGRGYSNREVVRTIEKITGNKLPTRYAGRRAGDPASIYADNTKAKKILHWEPKYSDLETIISSSFLWHQNHPDGFV